MRNAVITHAIRTPIAKAAPDKGWFRDVRADDLSADLMARLLERSRIDPHLVEDVRWGCVQQQGEQGMDVARQAWLIAELPLATGGITVNRNCASSLSAINDAASAIMAGVADVQVAGGVEHMGHIPMDKDYNPSPRLFRRHSEAIMHMGLTAEFLAMKYRISREQQDEFSLRSHQGAAQANERANRADEIIPTWGRDEQGLKFQVTQDQGYRKDTSKEALAALRPVFNPASGSVTAGNSSQISVGAAATLLMSEDKAKELGIAPLARVKAFGTAGVPPEEMGIGPVPAIHKALKKAGLKLEDIGAIEINEAFAVQVLSCLKLLGTDEKRVNTRGGAVSLGHPIGASGARITVTLLHRMRDEGIRYGLASLCVGQGQGVATIYELCG
ncbi:MAG TPA: acetyl-CoA C-acyltransferase [Gemmatales bacterium]|nr:acetyl-CoA C-acyltransferase [Gemmatales bacterium]HMP59787.1 acetyl-CoA C-acyltransferase [Gemmatales bacterium]